MTGSKKIYLVKYDAAGPMLPPMTSDTGRQISYLNDAGVRVGGWSVIQHANGALDGKLVIHTSDAEHENLLEDDNIIVWLGDADDAETG